MARLRYGYSWRYYFLSTPCPYWSGVLVIDCPCEIGFVKKFVFIEADAYMMCWDRKIYSEIGNFVLRSVYDMAPMPCVI